MRLFSKKMFGYILLIILVYILINDPFWIPTFGVLGRGARQHSVYLLALISIVYIFKEQAQFNNFVRIFARELFFIVLLILFGIILRRTFSGLDASSHIDMLMLAFLAPFFLIMFAINKQGIIDEDSFIRVILIISVIGGVLSCICIINPEFDSFVKNSILQMTDEDKANSYVYRSFGVASGLLYGYGTAQGIAMSLGIFYLRNHKWYLFCIPFVFISIIFNARTGLLMPIVAIAIYLLSSKRKVTAGIVVSLFVFFLISSPAFISLFGNEASSDWISGFFDQLLGVVETGDIMSSGTAGALLSSHIIWPSTFEDWIIGSGIDYARSSVGHSDVGFIRQLHYGGIFYCSILYGYVIYMIRRLWKFNYKNISMFFLMTFIICNIKGMFVPVSNGFLLLLLVYYFLIYSKDLNGLSKLRVLK